MGDGQLSNTMRKPVFSFLTVRERPNRWLVAPVVCLFFALAPPVWGQPADPLPMSTRVLTNITEIWNVPPEHQNEEYRIRTEVVIYFADTIWDLVWGECQGNRTWMPLFGSPNPLKAGQRAAIDGVIVPQRQRFVWDKTRIHILEENVGLKGEPVTDLGKNAQELKGHLISVEGLIDKMQDDSTHGRINFFSGNTMAYAYVLKGTNNLPFHFKEGDFVRMKCVDSPRVDRDGNLSILELWVSSPADIEVIGSLKTDARFDMPITLSERILPDSSGTIVRVGGVVRSYEPGNWVTLWDATGQIMVQSKQSQPLRFGDQVEAIGRPDLKGVQPIVLNGLYRLVATNNPTAYALMPATNTLPLRLTEQVRDLSPEEASRHLPVNLRAIVTWSDSSTPFAYLLDASGGIRVDNPKWDEPDTAKPGTVVLLAGVTSEGAFVPVVTNAVLRRTGWWKVEEQRQVTLERALSGVEEGNWVEMRGFVRDVIQTNGLMRFDLSTSSGEFQALTRIWPPFDSLKGSIIRVRGVCSAVANARHQLTGIQIWTPDGQTIETEESAPDDLFALPLRPLASLRRFSTERALNQRIRTSGTVVLHVPGHYLYVQDGVDSVFALSQQPDVLQPGDRVEVVGFPGKEGQKFVLREAVYRRLAISGEPKPVLLSVANFGDVNLEGLLAKTEGVLLNKMEKNGEMHLLIQTKDFTSEASLNSAAPETQKQLQALALGSRLALTGVYEVQSDESGGPRSFRLHLRSWNDVQLLQPPPWWTLARLLWVLAGVFAVFLIALVWGILIARKNALLNQVHTELQTANDRLEIRVAERTQELQDQVAAKERAHTELAQAQQSLMLASRRAGMAEVATGVLHNVGNVLNSVNVSTTLLRDRVRTSETHSLLKAAELLKQRNGDLAAFLTSDSRGKLMPEFIIQIAGQLQKEQEKNSHELERLTKNVAHIKDIVAMQQSYARVTGVAEKTALAGLVEDALQINSAALTHQGVTVIRQFEEVPLLMVDRQKVLQILINLVLNASYALDECTRNEKRLIITIAKADQERVLIRAEDNGIGIPPENLTRIFSHGFTTRPDGHGFGLHIGAINAREMGGSLSVASEGTGRGATFALILPMSPPGKKL
jgi:C4-dicarboxylate-specific signal transduction histidine kinase